MRCVYENVAGCKSLNTELTFIEVLQKLTQTVEHEQSRALIQGQVFSSNSAISSQIVTNSILFTSLSSVYILKVR